MIEYSSSRLSFKADIIESLNNEDEFAVHTPCGVFKMTKAEFMKQCEEFWDNRGTHCDDFEIMSIRLAEVRA